MQSSKRIGVFYATREGQTERVAEHVAADLRKHGFDVDIWNVRDQPSMDGYDAAVIAASVHRGSHEPEMLEFVRKYRDKLESIPAAFLSVTLSEAGAERTDATPEEHARFTADVHGMIEAFFRATGWHPKRVKPVAGALLYTKYNPLIRFILRRIAKKTGADTDASRDHEYTDWLALEHFINEFVEELRNTPIRHNPS